MTTKTIDLVSMYLHETVGGAHRIKLNMSEVKLGHWDGTVILDPNLCSLDAFGDAQSCTKIAVRPVHAEGTFMRLRDPAGLGRGLIRLRLDGQGGDWAMIEHERAGVYYLVVRDDPESVRVVPLLPAQFFAAPAPVEGSTDESP